MLKSPINAKSARFRLEETYPKTRIADLIYEIINFRIKGGIFQLKLTKLFTKGCHEIKN